MPRLVSFSAVLLLVAAAVPAADHSSQSSPEVVLEWLRYGNERHAKGKHVHWHQSPDRRIEVARKQRPNTIVLTCSDSQVPPEIVFDQGLGDLYVVRVAGNTAAERELGSIEYAAQKLGARLLVVLGHQRCGFVEAAVQGSAGQGHLGSILASLSAAVARARGLAGDPVENTTRANVEVAVRQLQQSEPVLAPLAESGRIKVMGAVYNPDSGLVDWMEEAKPGARHISSTALPH